MPHQKVIIYKTTLKHGQLLCTIIKKTILSDEVKLRRQSQDNLLDVQAILSSHATPTSTLSVHVPNFKLYVFAVHTHTPPVHESPVVQFVPDGHATPQLATGIQIVNTVINNVGFQRPGPNCIIKELPSALILIFAV